MADLLVDFSALEGAKLLTSIYFILGRNFVKARRCPLLDLQLFSILGSGFLNSQIRMIPFCLDQGGWGVALNCSGTALYRLDVDEVLFLVWGCAISIGLIHTASLLEPAFKAFVRLFGELIAFCWKGNAVSILVNVHGDLGQQIIYFEIF